MSDGPLAAETARFLELVAARLEERNPETARRLRLASRLVLEHSACLDHAEDPRAPRTCPVCGETLQRKGRGRPATYCGVACRRRAEKRRRNASIEA